MIDAIKSWTQVKQTHRCDTLFEAVYVSERTHSRVVSDERQRRLQSVASSHWYSNIVSSAQTSTIFDSNVKFETGCF